MVYIDRVRFDELKAAGSLPSPKGVALAVMQLAGRDDVTHGEIARTIKADPSLAGRIVKAANMANVASSRPIASVSDALVVLGLKAVCNLAMGFSLVADNRSGGCRRFDYDGFWARSLLTAVANQQIAARTRSALGEEAFLVGLLSRIGCLGIATAYPGEYADLLESLDAGDEAHLAEREQARFGIDHAQLTAGLMADWGLPAALVDPVFHHERAHAAPWEPGSRPHVLTWSLALAAAIGDLCLLAEAERREPMLELLGTLAPLGIEPDELGDLVQRCFAEHAQWLRLLEVRLPPPVEHKPAAQPARDDAPVADPPMRVLVAGSDSSARCALRERIAAAGHATAEAAGADEAMAALVAFEPELIVAQRDLGASDALALCRRLRETPPGRALQFLLVCPPDEEARIGAAFESGIDDYVLAPAPAATLAGRLRAARRRLDQRRADAADRAELQRLATELAAANRRLARSALTDPLTGLPNRRHALERLREAWSAARRAERPLACVVVDIDGLGRINERFGYAAGDAALEAVAAALRGHVRAHEAVCRIGGDRFLVICSDTEAGAAARCAQRLREAVEAIVLEGQEAITVTASLGAAVNADVRNPEDLVFAAGRAVDTARAGGGNRVGMHRSGRQGSLGLVAAV